MAKETLTSSNLTSGWYPAPSSKANVFIKGSTWAGASVQVEFRAPWGSPIADVRYAFAVDTVEALDAGSGAALRFVASGGGGTESIDVDVVPL